MAFCAKLSSEKVEFVQAYPHQSTEFFFDGLIRAFDFYGGIPSVFGNMKIQLWSLKIQLSICNCQHNFYLINELAIR